MACSRVVIVIEHDAGWVGSACDLFSGGVLVLVLVQVQSTHI
jgi:hypothetical protein